MHGAVMLHLVPVRPPLRFLLGAPVVAFVLGVPRSRLRLAHLAALAVALALLVHAL